MKFPKFRLIILLALLGNFSPPLLGNVSPLLPTSPALAQSSQSPKPQNYRFYNQPLKPFQVSQDREALQYWQTLVSIYREIGDQQSEAVSLNIIGIIYTNLGDYPKAIENFEQSLAIARDIGDREGEANSLENLAKVYKNLGDDSKATDFQQESLDIKQEIGLER